MAITIAIDGYSSCGKSTLAKELAAQLDYIFVDSGAMYRAVSFHFLNNNVDLSNSEMVSSSLKSIKLSFNKKNGEQRVLLNNIELKDELRSMAVNKIVSPVAELSIVRRKLVQIQQELGKNGGIVMDGRDIGTVVFPHAELKVFVTASIEERTRRRVRELQQMGRHTSEQDVLDNLLERDRIDSSRKDSPLRKAEDAILIDNTNLSKEEQLAMIFSIAKMRESLNS